MKEIKRPEYISEDTFEAITSLDLNNEYFMVLNLLTDKIIMPSVWQSLEKSNKAIDFVFSIINGISLYGMHSDISSAENYQLYSQAQNYLKKFVQAIDQSSDLLFNYQKCFEGAIYNAHKNRLSLQNYEKPNMENIHFMLLMRDIVKQADIWKKDSFDRNKKSIFPRKMKAKSAYRTYFVRVVYDALEEACNNVTYGLVADVISIMFLDEEPLDETHVRKLLQ